MATTAATYHKSPPRFDHAFIESRMRQHREWQQAKTAKDASEIIAEVSAALEMVQRVRAGKGPHKIARLR